MVECDLHENDLAGSFEEKESSVRPNMVWNLSAWTNM